MAVEIAVYQIIKAWMIPFNGWTYMRTAKRGRLKIPFVVTLYTINGKMHPNGGQHKKTPSPCTLICENNLE